MYVLIIHFMVIILEGNVAQEMHFFSEDFLKLATVVDVNKCLAQIELPLSLFTCAPISELPFNKNTMIHIDCVR